MLLEYLIHSEQEADACISSIMRTNAESSKTQLTDNNYIVAASLPSNSDASAKILSKLHEEISKSINCTVLTDDSSAYYDRVLFPLINKFERKLRKLLYAASVINTVGKDRISDLESKDFGQLFNLLFRDEKYFKNIKAFVNGNNKEQRVIWNGFADELRSYIESTTENPLWDALLPGKAPTLRKRFSDVKKYRNDVMHAHLIGRSEYLDAKRLFEDIISELDKAIESLANGALVPETYNNRLEEALAYLTDSGSSYIIDNEGNRYIAFI